METALRENKAVPIERKKREREREKERERERERERTKSRVMRHRRGRVWPFSDYC